MTAAGAERIVLFRIADERFAIDAAQVEEVVDGVAVRRLPGLPAHCPGVLLHRGAWLPAVDAAPLLAVPRGGAAAPGTALVVRRGRVRFALAVDAVVRVVERPREISGAAVGAVGEGGDGEAPLLEDEEGVITLLRPDGLFQGEVPEDSQESGMSNAATAAEPMPIVAFRLGTDEFGVDVQQVREVIEFVEPRPVPHAPDFVEGVIDVRGTIVPVVDLRKRFELPARSADADTRVLLVGIEHQQVGLLVDAVTEVVRVPPADITEPPTFFRGLAARYLAGLARAQSGLLILLRLDRILTSEERLALLGAESEAEAAVSAATPRSGRGKRSKRRKE